MTDKATVEIPSPRKAMVKALHFKEGDIIPVGAVMITMLMLAMPRSTGRRQNPIDYRGVVLLGAGLFGMLKMPEAKVREMLFTGGILMGGAIAAILIGAATFAAQKFPDALPPNLGFGLGTQVVTFLVLMAVFAAAMRIGRRKAAAMVARRCAPFIRTLRRSISRGLGRSQVVRQRILIPPSPGSNPGAPASPIQDSFRTPRSFASGPPRSAGH